MFAHIDADAFFASVLQRKRPELRGKPLLALGMGGGCVIAASYDAKAKGVKTGMRFKEAIALCPEALSMPSDFLEACAASREIEYILTTYCSRIERMSVDEWFLDLTTCLGGTPNDLQVWAERIQRHVTHTVGLSVSTGIGPTKTLAKMASEYRKPAGVTVLGPALSLEEFLRDRPAAAIPGIGRKRKIHAENNKWITALDVANAPEHTLVHLFGRPGVELKKELLGIPIYDIEEDPGPPKSISRCRSFRATRDRAFILALLLQHCSTCLLRMRRKGLACRRIEVWLRNGEYKHSGDGCRLPRPMRTEEELIPYIRRCFTRIYEQRTPWTQAGLALCELGPSEGTQYSLFAGAEMADRREEVQQSLDTLRQRYGRDSVVRAAALPAGLRKKSSVPTEFGTLPETA